MSDLVLTPTEKMRKPDLFEASTNLVKRTMLVGIASRKPDEVAVMVARARARGIGYRKIVDWLGPRVSCPPELLALRERLELLASLER